MRHRLPRRMDTAERSKRGSRMKGNSRYARGASLLAGAVALLGAATAHAQTAPAEAAGAAPANDEIVVTAQKRVQNINDVGLTVAAIGGDVFKERQINSLADLASVVPGLSFTQSGSNTPVYTLRGVGFYETT